MNIKGTVAYTYVFISRTVCLNRSVVREWPRNETIGSLRIDIENGDLTGEVLTLPAVRSGVVRILLQRCGQSARYDCSYAAFPS
jgi:hypothetical protein